MQIEYPELYQDYRTAMKPLLESFGGGFRYDFWIKEVLKNESDKKMNRVFAIYCRNKESMDEFFADPEYKKIKQKYFEAAVSEVTIISAYERS